MTITLELAAIMFLGTVTLYLLRQLGKAAKSMQQHALAAHATHRGLVVTYETLDKVLYSAKDDYPEAVEAIVSDFDNRMGENMAKLEAEYGV